MEHNHKGRQMNRAQFNITMGDRGWSTELINRGIALMAPGSGRRFVILDHGSSLSVYRPGGDGAASLSKIGEGYRAASELVERWEAQLSADDSAALLVDPATAPSCAAQIVRRLYELGFYPRAIPEDQRAVGVEWARAWYALSVLIAQTDGGHFLASIVWQGIGADVRIVATTRDLDDIDAFARRLLTKGAAYAKTKLASAESFDERLRRAVWSVSAKEREPVDWRPGERCAIW